MCVLHEIVISEKKDSMNLKKSREGNIKVLERGNGKEKCNFIIITKNKILNHVEKW